MSIEIAGTVHSIRLLWDLVKANKTLANYNELVAAVSEVNADLIAAQSATIASQKNEMTLTELVRELKEKIGKLENWEREAERYQLTEIAPGIPARVLKPGMEKGEASLPLCATCFEDHKKQFLQVGAPHQGTIYHCSRCNATFHRTATRPPRLPDPQEPPRDPRDPRVPY